MTKPDPIKLATIAWDEVAHIEAKIKKLDYKLGDRDRVALLLMDLREARRAAHYWQKIVNDDRGWV